MLQVGTKVQPSRDLVDLRPELDGASGEVVEVDPDGKVVIEWARRERLYRLHPAHLLTD